MVESKPWWPRIMNQTSTCWWTSFFFFMFCACFFYDHRDNLYRISRTTSKHFVSTWPQSWNTIYISWTKGLFALIIIIITAGCEDPNSKYYWSGRSTRKERRCSQIGGWPLKAKLGTINKYLEILPPLLELHPRDEKGCNQCWWFFVTHWNFFTQFQMTLSSYIAINPF